MKGSAESRLLRAFRLAAKPHPAVALGPGDDAALLRVGGRRLAWTADDLVEGTHFDLSWCSPAAAARRLVRVNLSDLAAMGRVRPLAALVTAGLPASISEAGARAIHRAAERECRSFGVALAGGNLARSPNLYFSMSLLGEARRTVRRAGARAGDLLAGIGPLGEAAAGLAELRSGRKGPLARRWLLPEPQLEAGWALAPLATSLMDNSDGLFKSALALAEASGVRIELELGEGLPSPALKRWCRRRGRDWREAVLSGGEDYGLVFTVPRRRWPAVFRRLPGAYLLGRVARGRGVDAPIEPKPFEHFA